jgi:hypothetical protein
MTLRHVVSWKLAAEDDETRSAQAAEVKRRLESLVGVVPSIRALSVGVNTAFPEENWDVALVADFADVNGLKAYGSHPAHLEAAEYIGSVRSGRVAVDFEV